ncbi:MAG: 3-ketoacyl-ACP reductase [Armatimonadetes bacterium]|nr:3-ketoacyl-ACP reductase [Armatimonadota bacterium]
MSRTSLITGSTRGIGYGIACALASEGFALALNGLRPAEAVQEQVEALRGRGVDVEYFQADISDADDRARLVRGVIETFGHVTVLVNNAGVAPSVRADLLDASEESFCRLMKTNLQGPFFLTQAVARHMIEQGAVRSAGVAPVSAIVFVTSVSAELASVNRGDYCMAKAGLSMAAKLWAVRLAEHGIPVYEVRPGIVATDMTAGVREKYDRMIEDGLLLERRWGTPGDVGRAVAALVRCDIPYATGGIITLDGGLTVGRL